MDYIGSGVLSKVSTSVLLVASTVGLPCKREISGTTAPTPTIVYWGYIGIMENKLETTIVEWLI